MTKALLMYLDRLSVALSQLLNTILGGDPHETLSSRMSRALARPTDCGFCFWASWHLCWFLDFLERDHCDKARERVDERLEAGCRVLGRTDDGVDILDPGPATNFGRRELREIIRNPRCR